MKKHLPKFKIINVHTASTLGITTASMVAMTQLAHAQYVDDVKTGTEYVDNGGSFGTASSLLQVIVNILLFLIGATSVIMLIIGGIRFIVSSGDSQATTNARNTILYSIIGIVVAVAAYGIVSWILGRLYNEPTVAPPPPVPGQNSRI